MRDQIRGLDLAVEYGKNNNSSTWLRLREKKTIALGALGGIILFVYGIILTLQPAEFRRVYAAYGRHIHSIYNHLGQNS